MIGTQPMQLSDVSGTVTLEVEVGRGGAGIVGTDDLNSTAIAGAVFLDHDDTVIRLLARSNAFFTAASKSSGEEPTNSIFL